MTYTGQFTVEVSADAATWTALTPYVIAANVRIGRQQITDRWTPDVATIELLAPPNSGPAIPPIGDYLRINGASGCYSGVITDVARDYGIKYTSATGAAPSDRITITAASRGMYVGGRAFYTNVAVTAGVVLNGYIDGTWFFSVDGALAAPQLAGTAGNFTVETGTISGNALDALNSAMVSCVGYMWDRGLSGIPNVAQNAERQSLNYVNFTDTGSQSSATNTYFYDQIEFLASDDNSYTETQIAYNNNAATASATSGSAPFNVYQTKSVLNTLSQAQQVADVLLSVVSQTSYRPFRISTKASIVGSFDLAANLDAYNLVGTSCTVTFRGTTYNMIIEGYAISQDLEDARYTFYFSPALNAALILDSTAFGILDTNTLGIG